jgi:hypothetical protein
MHCEQLKSFSSFNQPRRSRTVTSIDEAKIRFDEICKQIQELNLEAEKLLLAHSGGTTKGKGKCNHGVCACASYVHGDTPGVCARSHCGHYASEHAF